MKAMILAAGFGTRLAPYTTHTPKPLFTINGQTVLARIVDQLQSAGFREIMINTHHHHHRIEEFIAAQRFAIPVLTRHEPMILGTGGGLRNIADWWGGEDLLVINADIVTDIHPGALFAFHESHSFPVTMAMHDRTEFNSVWVDSQEFVTAFNAGDHTRQDCRRFAFTGIHVLSPGVRDFLPDRGFASIIDAYRDMLRSGQKIKARIFADPYWQDIGTPQGYLLTAYSTMAPAAFERVLGRRPQTPIKRERLKGDGSERHWYRLTCENHSLILAEHGIRSDLHQQEADAFVAIGGHLQRRGICVPRIVLHDCFAGMVFLEDLGDRHLQDVALQSNPDTLREIYRRVIDRWIALAIDGYVGFDPAWTYQSTHYDREMILEKEARYFMRAFLNGYMDFPETYDQLADEFECLAEGVEQSAVLGLMHRDLQSRNIMVKAEDIFFIDFQGARVGPLQYDLAALLIDPYVTLSAVLQDDLRAYAAKRLADTQGIDTDRFERGYRFCAVTRNLQMLGAFAFLSREKGKSGFEAYIPQAVANLRANIARLPVHLPGLASIADKLARQFQSEERSKA